MRLTPKEWHERNHVFPGPMAECGDCGRALRKCGGKITYPDATTASAEARRINVEREFERAVTPYDCRYCDGHHLTTAKRTKAAKRAERERRKWLRGRF